MLPLGCKNPKCHQAQRLINGMTGSCARASHPRPRLSDGELHSIPGLAFELHLSISGRQQAMNTAEYSGLRQGCDSKDRECARFIASGATISCKRSGFRHLRNDFASEDWDDMLTIRDSHHIPTNLCVPGHRTCRTHTGFFLGAGEAQRVQHEIIAMINRRLRFAWLAAQWKRHEGITRSQKEGR